MAEMENHVLEEDTNLVLDTTEGVKMKEYEKLLDNDANRKLNVKAEKMVKLGLFEQLEETAIDFSKLRKVTYKKLYKRAFNLYIAEDGQLVYIHEKTESESGRAYAYDILAIEKVTDEEYNQILKASVHEKEQLIKVGYWTSMVLLILSTLLTVALIVYYLIAGLDLASTLALQSQVVIALGTFYGIATIETIAYRNFISK